MMDLGFSGLIEKIEERFGKWLGTLLMAVLSGLVLLFCVDYFLAFVINTITALETAEGAAYFFESVKLLGTFVLILFFFLLLMNVAFDVWFRRRWRHMTDEVEKRQEQAAQAIDDAKKMIAESKQLHKAVLKESEAAVERAEKSIGDTKRQLMRYTGTSSEDELIEHMKRIKAILQTDESPR